MLIIGERINTSRRQVAEAVQKKDKEFIKLEAKKQTAAGADFIDINCGTNLSTEAEDLKWVAEQVVSAVNLPLCIDSPNPQAIETALCVCKGKAFVNSVTAENQRAKAILPLVKRYDSFVIGLAMDEKGVPVTACERKEAVGQILKFIDAFKIDRDKLYIDALIQPVGVDVRQGLEFLNAVKAIKTSFGLKTIAGLSNVSFGLPKRAVLNRSFLAMAIAYGLDAAIVDITDPQIYSTLKTANALVGNDLFCQEYISAFRNGKLC